MPPEEDLTLAKHPFRGLVHTVLVILGVLIVTGVCWCIWAFIAHRRLQAQIDAIAASHEPFFEKDFAVAPLPDDRNAAVLWQRVFAACPTIGDSPSNSNLQYQDYPPFPPEWHQKENNSIVVNAKLLNLAHLAAAVNEVDWGEKSRLPFSLFPYSQSRTTANIIGDAILHAHLHGNDASAIERAVDIAKLANTEDKIGSLLARLVAVGIRALMTERLLVISPDLAIDNGPDPFAPANGIAGRYQVQALIRSLLDEAKESRARIMAVDCERMQNHLVFQDAKKQRWTLGPLIDLTEARSLAQCGIDRLASEASSETAAKDVYVSHSAGSTTPESTYTRATTASDLINFYDGYAMGTFLKSIEMQWKGVANRRAAAVALAIRLYRLDHPDQWPGSLAELVPTYLPSVPADPFDPDGSPIGYVIRKNALPDGSDRPMLYYWLTGDPNAIALPPTPCFGWTSYPRGNGPQWRDLSRWYPVAFPSSSGAASAPTTASSPQTGNH